MNFEWALAQLRDGRDVRRDSWNHDAFMRRTDNGSTIAYHSTGSITTAVLSGNMLLAEDWELRAREWESRVNILDIPGNPYKAVRYDDGLAFEMHGKNYWLPFKSFMRDFKT